MTSSRLLLLSPSAGAGYGIERVVCAVEAALDGAAQRIDLVSTTESSYAPPGALTKAGFAVRALWHAIAWRPDEVVCLHIGLLPVAAMVAFLTRSRLALMAYGVEVWSPMP